MIPCLHQSHPQRKGGSLGAWNNVVAALRRDSGPPALLPGALGTPPNHLETQSSLQPGPWDLQILPRSRLAWESPRGRLIVPLLPLFLCRIVPVISILHAAAAAQESVAAAEAAAEAADGRRCPAGRAACTIGSPTPDSESRPSARVVECRVRGPDLFGVFWSLVLEALGQGPLLSSSDIGRHVQFLQVSPSRSLHKSESPCHSFLLR